MSHALSLRRLRGFSLIELMITVAIIGILAAIAIPAFDSQTRKSHRAAAQALMMDIANKQAFYLQSQREYAVGTGNAVCATLGVNGGVVPPEVAQFYTLDVAANNAATPPTYSITLAPIAGKKQVKDGPLVLTSTGTKTRSGDPTLW